MNGPELLREMWGPGLWGERRSGSRLAEPGGQGHPGDRAAWSMRPGGKGCAHVSFAGWTHRETHTLLHRYTITRTLRYTETPGSWGRLAVCGHEEEVSGCSVLAACTPPPSSPANKPRVHAPFALRDLRADEGPG